MVVLDAQEELAARRAGLEPAEQRAAGIAEVDAPRGAGAKRPRKLMASPGA